MKAVAVVADYTAEAWLWCARHGFAHASRWEASWKPKVKGVVDDESDREEPRCRLGLHGSVERVIDCVLRSILVFGPPELGSLSSGDCGGAQVGSARVYNLRRRGGGRWRHDGAHAIGEDEEDIILVVSDHCPVGFRLPVALVGLVEIHIITHFRKESAVLVLGELNGGVKLLLKHGHGACFCAESSRQGGGEEEK